MIKAKQRIYSFDQLNIRPFRSFKHVSNLCPSFNQCLRSAVLCTLSFWGPCMFAC